VRRAVFVVLLTLLTFDVSGLAALCDEASCDETCPTDVSGGQCPPNCHYCSCCSLPKVTGAAAVPVIAPVAHRVTCQLSNEGPPSRAPADILHVPKLLA
jgi:hypothetical protein